jgi:hypothetical protein
MTMLAKPPIAQGDPVVSMAIVLIAVVGVAASAMGLRILAFLDSCPPDECSETGAVASMWTAIMVAVLVGLAGVVVTIVRLVRRSRRGRSPSEPSWPAVRSAWSGWSPTSSPSAPSGRSA